MAEAVQATLAIIALTGVIWFAVRRPKGLPEALAAVPAALLLCLCGVIGWGEAAAQIREMAPTVVFLAAILALSHLCQREGLFRALGELIAQGSGGHPGRLLLLVFVIAALVTAVLSLDATAVLLTPVVFATASRLGVRPKPHVYATAHLANSASLLLPVSNLTNLLAMSAAGLSFTTFAGVMAVPWLLAIGIEYAVFRRYFRADLSVPVSPRESARPVRLPLFAIGVVAATLAGFVASGSLHLEPFWAAIAGAAVLAGKRLLTRRRRFQQVKDLAGSVNPWFAAFVFALAIVVKGVTDHGLTDALRAVLPHGTGWPELLWMAAVAALLANVVNNLPAVLVLLPLAAPMGPLAVLAVLIGVNVGPNLTYVGSLATLLWRRIMADHEYEAELKEFTLLGLLTVPLSLVLCSLGLWAGGVVFGLS